MWEAEILPRNKWPQAAANKKPTQQFYLVSSSISRFHLWFPNVVNINLRLLSQLLNRDGEALLANVLWARSESCDQQIWETSDWQNWSHVDLKSLIFDRIGLILQQVHLIFMASAKVLSHPRHGHVRWFRRFQVFIGHTHYCEQLSRGKEMGEWTDVRL